MPKSYRHSVEMHQTPVTLLEDGPAVSIVNVDRGVEDVRRLVLNIHDLEASLLADLFHFVPILKKHNESAAIYA